MFSKFSKPEPLDGYEAIPDATDDKQTAVRCGQYRISRSALYYPNGRYIPLRAVQSVSLIKDTLSGMKDFPLALPRPAVAVNTGSQNHILLASTRKQVEALVRALQDRPQL